MDSATIKQQVRERYASAARRVQANAGTGCGCGSGGCCGATTATPGASSTTGITESSQLDYVAGIGYGAEEVAALPAGAVTASLGCGNPTASIDLHPGETVLDLGSGGGIDVLLAARRVGPTGRAIGIDMTDEMLDLARTNAVAAGVANVEFRKGELEALPLPDASVDAIVSNCVVNLSPDKDTVLREAYRVLKPGGRLAISDIVAQGLPLPPDLQADLTSWAGCAAGALFEHDYYAKLQAAGFQQIAIVPTQTAPHDDAEVAGCCATANTADQFAAQGGQLVSAFVRATKPLDEQR